MVICAVFLDYPRKWVTFTLSYPAFAKEDVADSDIRGVCMSFEMIPIPPEKVRGWKVSVDGVSLPNASFVVIESQRYGKFVYGLRPEGYDSMVYIEPGGGGSVTLPFSYNSKTGELLVGLLPASRPNMGPGMH
ncbi:MAG TPA: hypothetical protein PK295_01670, partial [Candidatus Magasanikbacteria bacterium]|nr:hypothetical protein [Candidatus Magasanikbacteria bacterium]